MKSLFPALIKFQKNVKAIPKNKINPHYKNRYAELSAVIDVCQPALNEFGLAVFQTFRAVENKNILVTTLCHESGEVVESCIFLPDLADAQKLTGAITYLRRSSYLSILGLVADDDLDGNDAVDLPPLLSSQYPTNTPAPRPANVPSTATDAQKGALKRMGIKFEENISKQQASYLIAQHANNKKN